MKAEPSLRFPPLSLPVFSGGRRDGFLIDCDSRFLLDLGLAEVRCFHSSLFSLS